MKKSIALLLALVMIIALAACNGGTTTAPTSAPTTTEAPAPIEFTFGSPLKVTNDRVSSASDRWDLNFSLSFPERSAAPLLPILESITEKSGGKVTFTMYYSWSLFGVADAVEYTANGVADIAIIPPHEFPSIFKVNSVTSGLPLVGWPGSADATKIYSELCLAFPELVEEFADNNLTLWGSYFMPPYNIYQTDRDQIITPADLNGRKMITASRDVQDLIRAKGGAPISSMVPSYFSDLSGGVADSVIAHINVLGAFGVVPDLVNSRTIFGDGGLLMYNLAYVFNTDTWESLPGDIQQLFVDAYSDLVLNMTAGDLNLTNLFEGRLAEKGIDTYVLNEAEIAEWESLITPIRASLFSQLESEGFTGVRTIYNTLKERIAYYKAQ